MIADTLRLNIKKTHFVFRDLFCRGFKVRYTLFGSLFSHKRLFVFLLPPVCPVFHISYYIPLTSTPHPYPVLFLPSAYCRTITLLYKLYPPTKPSSQSGFGKIRRGGVKRVYAVVITCKVIKH